MQSKIFSVKCPTETLYIIAHVYETKSFDQVECAYYHRKFATKVYLKHHMLRKHFPAAAIPPNPT